jgi:hypothetical protein
MVALPIRQHERARRPKVDALASCRAALAVDQNNPEVIYNQGGAEQELGRHEEALASFARAASRHPLKL